MRLFTMFITSVCVLFLLITVLVFKVFSHALYLWFKHQHNKTVKGK